MNNKGKEQPQEGLLSDDDQNDTPHEKLEDKPRQSQNYSFYLLTVIITAACGLIVEIVAGRMLAPYLGMSLYTWTAIIAVVLAGFSIGHWIGGLLADKPPKQAQKLLGWVLLGAAISTVGSLVLLRLISGPVLSLGFTPIATIIIFTTALFFLPSLFVGVPSPMLTKLALDERPQQTGRVLGVMFAGSALGSIFGTLLAGFLFISWLGTIRTMIAVAMVYLLLAIIFFWRASHRSPRELAAPVGVGLGALVLFAGMGQKSAVFTSNCLEESAYYCIRVDDISDQIGAPAKIMILDHLAHGMNMRTPADLFLSSYVELTDRLVKLHWPNETALSAFFIGGGAYTLPRAWAKDYRQGDIAVAEIDPRVTALAQSEMWVEQSPVMRSLTRDARQALRAEQRSFSVIVGDAFHDIAVPQHLVTKEFFKLVHTKLSNRGIYIMNVVDHHQNPRFLLSVLRTLKQSFRVAEVWQDLDQEKELGRSTYILLAGSQASPLGVMKSHKLEGRIWRRWSAQKLLQTSTGVKTLVLSDDFSPVDRLLADGKSQ